MAQKFELPDLGEGIHEAEIKEVPVSAGDTVEEDDVILTVETDKATVEIPSPFAGEIQEIHVESGDIISVGDVLLTFSGSGNGKTDTEEEDEEAPEKSGKAEREEPEKKKAGKAEEKEEDAGEEEAPQRRKTSSDRPVPASPATRRLARELGVDLQEIEGSGSGGRVTSDDVRAFAEEGKPTGEEKPAPEAEEAGKEKRPAREAPAVQAGVPDLPDFARWGEVERVPLRSFRRTIARRMAQSWSQIPHVSHHDQADITELEQVRREYRGEMDLDDLTMTVFAMKAVVAALQEIPLLNASIDMESQEIILKHYYHLGIAVDTERGLTVPVVRDVDQKRITELVEELSATIERARAGESSMEDLQGGTFTITNVGPLGGTHFDPLVNFPQVGILGMAQARWQPMVRSSDDGGERQIEPRYMLPLVLSFDHRVADGADAARFVSSVVAMLEDPNKLMLMM